MPMRCDTLAAEFVLDAEGKPKFAIEDSRGRHWQIVLKLVNVPTDVASVTYKLDESYWDPLREVVRPRTSGPVLFEQPITSFGDYKVKASVSGSPLAGQRHEGQLSKLLEDSLEQGVPGGDAVAIRAAIIELRDH